MECALTMVLLRMLVLLALSSAAASAAVPVQAGVGALHPAGDASAEGMVSISVAPEAYHRLTEGRGSAEGRGSEHEFCYCISNTMLKLLHYEPNFQVFETRTKLSIMQQSCYMDLFDADTEAIPFLNFLKKIAHI